MNEGVDKGDKDVSQDVGQDLMTKWHKYAYTIIICLNHIAFGMTASMFAPVMVDMKHILNTTMRMISLYATFFSAGYMTGTIFGFFYHKINRQITAIICVTLMSISSAFTPISQDLCSLYICSFIIGLGGGVWNSMASVWMIELWQNKSAPFLQLLHFGFGVGNIFSPLVLEQHLVGETHENSSKTDIFATVIVADVNQSSVPEEIDRRSGLLFPFFINGVIQIIAPIALSLMFVFKRYEKSDNYSVTECQQKLFDRKDFPRKRAIVLFSIWLSTYCVSESTILGFGATYFQFCPLQLTAREAAALVSIVAMAFTVGRGISVVMALQFKPEHMIGYHFVLLFLSVILMFIGQHNHTVLLISVVMAGLGLSAMCPAMFAFLEQYINITNPIGATAILFSDAINLVNPYILGAFVENNSFFIIVFELVYISMCSVLFFSILILVNVYSNRYQTTKL